MQQNRSKLIELSTSVLESFSPKYVDEVSCDPLHLYLSGHEQANIRSIYPKFRALAATTSCFHWSKSVLTFPFPFFLQSSVAELFGQTLISAEIHV